MTDVVVPLVPPRLRAARSNIGHDDAIADLYHATTADAATAVDESGGQLVLAVGQDSDASAFASEFPATVFPDADIDELSLDEEGQSLADAAALRAIRAHSDAATVGIIDPSVGLIRRRHLDTAAMRLRREDVVIGPTPEGGWYYVGTGLEAEELPDMLDPSLDRLMDELDEDLDIGFLPLLPVIRADHHLAGVGSLLEAMDRSGRRIAPYTRAWLESHGETVATDTS